MTTGRLITLACCAAILVLGVEAAPRIPTPLRESENEVRVDLRSDEVLSSGFLTDMERPRCGVVDEDEPNTGSRTKRWARWGKVWNRTELTFGIVKYPSEQPDKDEVDREITRAFATWGKYVDLSFVQVTFTQEDLNLINESAFGNLLAHLLVDIVIKFESGAHGDNGPFDERTLAHAFASKIASGIHFNDDMDWDLEKLHYVAVHEIGHTLGLHHSTDRESIMYPWYSQNADGELGADDIAGIQALYGVKANSITEDPSLLRPQDM